MEMVQKPKIALEQISAVVRVDKKGHYVGCKLPYTISVLYELKLFCEGPLSPTDSQNDRYVLLELQLLQFNNQEHKLKGNKNDHFSVHSHQAP